jgi:hypothetical protein
MVSMAVSVTLPEKLCGRCAIAVADDGLLAAQKKLLQMRKRDAEAG